MRPLGRNPDARHTALDSGFAPKGPRKARPDHRLRRAPRMDPYRASPRIAQLERHGIARAAQGQQTCKAFAVGAFIGPQNHQFQFAARVSLDPFAIAGSGLRCRDFTTRDMRGLDDRPGCFWRPVCWRDSRPGRRGRLVFDCCNGRRWFNTRQSRVRLCRDRRLRIGGFRRLGGRWPFSGGNVLRSAGRNFSAGLPRIGRSDQPIQCSEIAAQRNDDCEHVSDERRHRDTLTGTKRRSVHDPWELQGPAATPIAPEFTESALRRRYQ
jgi:hypothetical protein